MRINREQGKGPIPVSYSPIQEILDPSDSGDTTVLGSFVASLLALSPSLGALAAPFPHLQYRWCWV